MKKFFHLIPGARLVVAIGIGVLVFLFGPNPVWAHAQLVKSNPSDKAELKESPKQVELWFDELLDNDFNQVESFPAAELTAKHPVNLTRGEPMVDSKDRTHLTAELSPLKPGEYVVRYRVLSRDGHTSQGQLTFQVDESKR